MSTVDWTEFEGTTSVDADNGKWSPNKPGDKLVGPVVSLKIVDTKYGRCPLAIIDAKEAICDGVPGEPGTYEYWVSQAQAKRRFAEERVQAGDAVAVAYTGDVTLDNGNVMKSLDVAVKRPDTPAPAPAAASAADALADF